MRTRCTPMIVRGFPFHTERDFAFGMPWGGREPVAEGEAARRSRVAKTSEKGVCG